MHDESEAQYDISCFTTSMPQQHPILSPNMRISSCVDAAYQGGVLPNICASFLACNTFQLPLSSSQQVQAQATEAADKYQNASGPVDVWLDTTVINYITQGSVPADLPAHEKCRVQRRSRVYKFEAGVLHRVFSIGESRVVPHPDKRAGLIKQAHEQHGHFGVKRITALLLPYYWWAGMGQET
eukprot:1143615-Pelagomonas_calceolata.AAC.2